MSSPTVRDVALDPEWLPHTYDVGGTDLTSVFVPRPARAELMFLSDEHFAGNFRKATFPAAAVAAEAANADRAPVHFIFHTSFCCSTLLANALAIPGKTTALKEPDVLINLANRIISSDDNANRQRLELVLRLLERPLAPGETVIVKPTNFANRLADLMLASRPEARAVLLYSDVGTFLRSLLKRGMWGRILGRKLFRQLSGWNAMDFGFGPNELFELTDVQVAALAWLVQIRHFDGLARAFASRLLVLDSAALLADPVAALANAQSLLGLGLSESEIASIAAGPVFTRHSKFSDRGYNPEERDKEHAAVSGANAEELAMVVQWIEAVAAQIGAPLRPGSGR